jgi:oligopeptide/dipeptide ABC transporter ATP-binding protein
MIPLLEVRDLSVSFAGERGESRPVDGVTLTARRGEFLAVVGESGCGKSLTALALMRLLPPSARVAPAAMIRFDGIDLPTLDAETMRRIRGRRIGMVFQDPMSTLNPVFTVGQQLRETLEVHYPADREATHQRALRLIAEVGLPDPAGASGAYPHQLSGGMRQRALIALALAGEPDLLVADEPTTALDVTVQAQILELLDRLRVARGMTMLFITHDLGLVAGRADRVAVMYAGRVVEEAPVRALFAAPAHPYTRGLLRAIPRLEGDPGRLVPIAGGVPAPDAWPAGCRFHPRCPERLPACSTDEPRETTVGDGHHVHCWLHPPTASADA